MELLEFSVGEHQALNVIWIKYMNCAFFISNFKGFLGMSYFINGNINALNWLSDKLKHVLSSTANSIISIGDGNPFFSNGYIVDIVIDDSLAEPEFQPMDNQRYRLSMNRDDFVELSGKIDGMVDLKKPCHNYFDIGSGYVSQIFLTTGEYSDPLLIKMAQDGRLR